MTPGFKRRRRSTAQSGYAILTVIFLATLMVLTVMLAAPTAPDERLPRVAARARGFVYSVGLLGVTGERESLAASATELARRLKAITDVPVLVGVGVSNAEQARQACTVADGVIQGASVVRRLMDGGPEAVGDYVAEVRAAIQH